MLSFWLNRSYSLKLGKHILIIILLPILFAGCTLPSDQATLYATDGEDSLHIQTLENKFFDLLSIMLKPLKDKGYIGSEEMDYINSFEFQQDLKELYDYYNEADELAVNIDLKVFTSLMKSVLKDLSYINDVCKQLDALSKNGVVQLSADQELMIAVSLGNLNSSFSIKEDNDDARRRAKKEGFEQ